LYPNRRCRRSPSGASGVPPSGCFASNTPFNHWSGPVLNAVASA
jgi:hypothetical protein